MYIHFLRIFLVRTTLLLLQFAKKVLNMKYLFVTTIPVALIIAQNLVTSFQHFFFIMSLFECVCCSHTNQQSSPVIEPQTGSDESKSEPLTVIQQAELISSQPTAATANQAMKGTFVQLGYDFGHNFFSFICVRTFFPTNIFPPPVH